MKQEEAAGLPSGSHLQETEGGLEESVCRWHSHLSRLPASAALNRRQTAMLASTEGARRAARCLVLLNLKGLCWEKIDDARWGAFPGGLKLKPSRRHGSTETTEGGGVSVFEFESHQAIT